MNDSARAGAKPQMSGGRICPRRELLAGKFYAIPGKKSSGFRKIYTHFTFYPAAAPMPWVYGGTRSAVQEKSPDPDFRAVRTSARRGKGDQYAPASFTAATMAFMFSSETLFGIEWSEEKM